MVDYLCKLSGTTQIALEALVENDTEKAEQVMASKIRFNGMLKRAHSHLYVVLNTYTADDLELYKILNSSLVNSRRIHVLFRNISRLITKGAPPRRIKGKKKTKQAQRNHPAELAETITTGEGGPGAGILHCLVTGPDYLFNIIYIIRIIYYPAIE